MDKPLELYVSDNKKEQECPMHVNLPFRIDAIVANNSMRNLDWITDCLDNIDNFNWQSAAYSEPYLANSRFNVNLVLLLLPNDEVEARTALAYASNFGCNILLIGLDTPQNILRLAFQYDVADFIPFGTSQGDLCAVIEKLSVQLMQKADLAPVLAIINGKSGSGASFISASLADIASKKEGADIALLDLDLHQGTLSHILGRESKYSMCDVLSSIESLDEVALQSTMTKEGNLSLLAARPFELLALDQEIDFSNIKELILKYRQFHKTVILDFSRGPENWNYNLLLDATILVITQQNIMYLRQTKDLVTQLTKRMGIPLETINLVVNRYDKNSSIKLSDIKEAIGVVKIFTTINDYKLASECVELGKPIQDIARKQKLVADIEKLAEVFLPSNTIEPEKKTGFWKRILGK
ncbi:pilus assembly protein CpaE [Shewanella marinintestina]|uniref:AAA family ATPase n=1 Tax=Shewanella marinintestina TaxID=190305 RepID=UPI00200F96C5|nr:pilus assembly protein CpaE [Shewanella marinintestina]MCL1144557.1 pilus assembly protein CpaE [Shewanella marinintestina]